MLSNLVSDNHTLADLIGHSDRFIARFVVQRRQLSGLIRVAGQTMQTTAERRADLRQTLALAPATLASAQRFLADLRATAVPLDPAARAITATAPELTATLDQLPAFQHAAQPTLANAIRVAPLLSRLAVQATPVISRANPTLQALAEFARASGPLTSALNISIDDTLGLIEGWARSIQGSDHVGHVFHGRALLGPELIRSLLSSLLPAKTAARRRAGAQTLLRIPPAGTSPVATTPSATRGTSQSPAANLPQSLGQLPSSLPQLLSGLTGGAKAPSTGGQVSQLLNYLLRP
jgi:hypothetical protein